MARVTELFDFRKAELPEHLFAIKIKQEKIEKRLHQAAERFLTIEPQTDNILKNDIVAVSLRSSKPYLTSESEHFRVGRGFFYPEVEEQITGYKAGDVFTCSIDGENVTVEVLSVKRRIVPVLTDELVSGIGIEGIETLAEYTEYVKDQLAEERREKKQNAVCELVNRQVLRNSVFEIEENEIERMQDEMLFEFEEGTESPEEFENLMLHLFHAENMEAARAGMRKKVEEHIKIAAAADKIAEDYGMSWSEEDYMAFIRESASERMSEEELLEEIPMDDFISQQKTDFYQGLILEYFDSRFHVEVDK